MANTNPKFVIVQRLNLLLSNGLISQLRTDGDIGFAIPAELALEF